MRPRLHYFGGLSLSIIIIGILALRVHALAQAQPQLNHNHNHRNNAPSSSSSSPSATTQQQCQSSGTNNIATTSINILDIAKLTNAIQSGRVYQHFDFLSPDQVDLVWEEIRHLEDSGAFARSGLSNTAVGKGGNHQQFGARDRTLCPVPWWADSLVTSSSSPSSSNSSSSSSPAAVVAVADKGGISDIAARIHAVRLALAIILDRPTMADPSLAHECYYSMSTIGSFLPRHMDERHEELKGAKGWLLPSRRSLSWLIYLSHPPDWTLEEHGGALRTFPPQQPSNGRFGQSGQLTHDQGNLQIGWLFRNNNNNNDKEYRTQQQQQQQQPVYLDSWFPVSARPGRAPEPHCILYTRNRQQEQVILTKPWLTELVQGISVSDFLRTWAQRQSSAATTNDHDKDDDGLFLRREYAQQFALIEDRQAWDNEDGSRIPPKGSVPEDIAPIRGSLVIFDSVTLPHQVEIIKKGKRVALAGWFHEETQPFPDGLYS